MRLRLEPDLRAAVRALPEQRVGTLPPPVSWVHRGCCQDMPFATVERSQGQELSATSSPRFAPATAEHPASANGLSGATWCRELLAPRRLGRRRT